MSQQSTRWEQAAAKYEQYYDAQRTYIQEMRRGSADAARDSVARRLELERVLDAAEASLRDFFRSTEWTAAQLLLAASMEAAVLGRALGDTFTVMYLVTDRGVMQALELSQARRSDQVHSSHLIAMSKREFVRALYFECHIDPSTVMARLRAELDRIANLAPDLV